jgi:hypothetical protein
MSYLFNQFISKEYKRYLKIVLSIYLIFSITSCDKKNKIYYGILSDELKQELNETTVTIDYNIDNMTPEYFSENVSLRVAKIKFESGPLIFDGYIRKSFNKSFYELKNPTKNDSINQKYFSYTSHSNSIYIWVEFVEDTLFLESYSNETPFKFIGVISDKPKEYDNKLFSDRLKQKFEKKTYLDYVEHFAEYNQSNFKENKLIDGTSTEVFVPSKNNFVYNVYDNSDFKSESDPIKKAYIGEFEDYVKNKLPFIVNVSTSTKEISGNNFEDAGFKRKDIGETWHYGNYNGMAEIIDLRFFYYDSLSKEIKNAKFGYRYLLNGYKDKRRDVVQKGFYSFYADTWNTTLQNSRFCNYFEKFIINKIFDKEKLVVDFPNSYILTSGSPYLYSKNELNEKFKLFFNEFKNIIEEEKYSEFIRINFNSDSISYNGAYPVKFNDTFWEVLHRLLKNNNLEFSQLNAHGTFEVTNWKEKLQANFLFEKGVWKFLGIYNTKMLAEVESN